MSVMDDNEIKTRDVAVGSSPQRNGSWAYVSRWGFEEFRRQRHKSWRLRYEVRVTRGFLNHGGAWKASDYTMRRNGRPCKYVLLLFYLL